MHALKREKCSAACATDGDITATHLITIPSNLPLESTSLNPNSVFLYLPLRSLMGLWLQLPEALRGSAKGRGPNQLDNKRLAALPVSAVGGHLSPHFTIHPTQPPASSQTVSSGVEGSGTALTCQARRCGLSVCTLRKHFARR